MVPENLGEWTLGCKAAASSVLVDSCKEGVLPDSLTVAGTSVVTL